MRFEKDTHVSTFRSRNLIDIGQLGGLELGCSFFDVFIDHFISEHVERVE